MHHLSDYRRGFGLETGFIDHFNTRLMTTRNYSAIANLQILQITTTHSKFFQSAVFSPVLSC
jgi:predicted MPP superfamily phosphohydrolase